MQLLTNMEKNTTKQEFNKALVIEGTSRAILDGEDISDNFLIPHAWAGKPTITVGALKKMLSTLEDDIPIVLSVFCPDGELGFVGISEEDIIISTPESNRADWVWREDIVHD